MRRSDFCQTQIYDILEKHGPLRVKEIYALAGVEYRHISNALQKMREKGCVVSTGNAKATRWSVTPKHPIDMRGKTVGSQRALRQAGSINLWNCWPANDGRFRRVS